MSKGSGRRPRSVSLSTFSDNWDAAFGKHEETEPQLDDVLIEEVNVKIIDDKKVFYIDIDHDLKLDELKKELDRLKEQQHSSINN